jgi:outer membrane lipoprotein-sorting protein
MTIRIQALAVASFFIASASAAPAADSLALIEARAALEKLAKKHGSAKTFSLKFEAAALGPDGEPLPKSKGTLLSGDSGRFRLEHAQGVVVCDGATLWQYFPSTRQVIVRSAGDMAGAGTAGGVLLRFLGADPLRAQKIRGGLRVNLDPASAGENLDSLVLILGPGPAVRRVETWDPAGGRVEYAVKSLKLGVRTRARDFAAPNPPGAEVVDMR